MPVRIFVYVDGRVLHIDLSNKTSDRFTQAKLKLRCTTKDIIQTILESYGNPKELTEEHITRYLDILENEGGLALPSKFPQVLDVVKVTRRNRRNR